MAISNSKKNARNQFHIKIFITKIMTTGFPEAIIKSTNENKLSVLPKSAKLNGGTYSKNI